MKNNFPSVFQIAILIVCTVSLSYGKISIPGSLSREHTVQPGDMFEGTILVQNTGTETTTAKIYQTDYRFDADGSRRYDAPGLQDRSNAGWLTVSPPELTLAPGETVPVYYRGTVPSTFDREGTFWSVIMVEGISAPREEGVNSEKEISLGIRTTVRYGVQVRNHIGDSGSRQLEVVGRSLVKEDSGLFLQLDVKNTGTRAMGPSAAVEFFDSDGTPGGRAEALRKIIYPECSVRYLLDISNVDPGDYQALVVFDNGDDHLFGARYSLRIEP